VEEELTSFGGEVISRPAGAVTFTGTLETAYRACLWSRFSSRILLSLSDFPAPDEDALYQGVKTYDWSEHLDPGGTFAVDCNAVNSPITHTHFAALRVKDAVADQFRDRYHHRPSVDLQKPHIRIHVFLQNKRATVSLDLSGDPLHKRGYRVAGARAPLKESLAAGIVWLAGWRHGASPESTFLDPMCGSGTLLIEAALIYGDVAPGLGREYHGFLGWRLHKKPLWESLVHEATQRRQLAMAGPWPRIVGYDASGEAVRAALENIDAAGLRGLVHVERKELAHLANPRGKTKHDPQGSGLLVVNPPYGERIGVFNAIGALYRFLGRKLQEEFSGWRAAIFTMEATHRDALGMSPLKRHRLFNGPLACELGIYEVKEATETSLPPPWRLPRQPFQVEAEAFANRLRKNLKHLSKWVDRESIFCFRIYDADIPEYNVAVDLYEHFVYLQEYAPPKTVEPEKAARRFHDMTRTIPGALGVRPENIFLKVRSKQKGNRPYQRTARGRFFEVREDNCRFLVNLTDYQDTGLFLDHRNLRRRVQEHAPGKRFLNLFAHTGPAAVHAAMGGAKSTISVDSSPVYLGWARSNLALNGFSEENHLLVQADCMDWLSSTRKRFDLILLAPPTFSAFGRSNRTLDLQRRHVALIELAMRALERGGVLFFATGLSRFALDSVALSGFQVEEISRATIPYDFRRSRRTHRCWEIRYS